MLCKVKVFMAVNLMAILLLVVEVEGRVLVVSLVYVRLGFRVTFMYAWF